MEQPGGARESRTRAGWETRVGRGRAALVLLGPAMFLAVYFAPAFGPASDPSGISFPLTHQGKAAIGLALMAALWWIFEVVPIGVTGLAVGAMQPLFFIRPAREAFRDFLDPALMFVFGLIIFGVAFTRSGLARRLAYKTMAMAGESASLVLLGCMLLTAALSHFFIHTAVVAAVFPLLVGVSTFYDETGKPTNFGKSLFLGMAFASGAGSIVSLLGSARAPVALGIFSEFTGKNVDFLEFSKTMAVVAWPVVLLVWAYLSVALKPEKGVMPGLRKRAGELSARMGPITAQEIILAVLLLFAALMMSLQSFLPPLRFLDRPAIIVSCAVLLFVFRVLAIKDLEAVPWNIVLLFGGAFSLGLCLWQTGAAKWLALNLVALLGPGHGTAFLVVTALSMLLVTNVIMNVVTISVLLPIALIASTFFGFGPGLILYLALAVAGMPFLLLSGVASNLIACESRQFTAVEFFRHGAVATLILLFVLAIAVRFIWPLLGMNPFAG